MPVSTPAFLSVTAIPALEATRQKLRVFADPRFSFEPLAHQYLLDERELVSCTNWVKQFAPFDRLGIAQGLAERRGCALEDILSEWDRAAWVGTKTHEFIEHFYLGTSTPEMALCDPEVSVRVDKFLRLQRTRLKQLVPVAQELRVFHESSGLCGTLDFLAYSPVDEKLYILDWKTSKKIATDSDRCFRHMLGAFSAFPENEHNTYSLQLSAYRVLLEEVGVEVAGCFIAWLPAGDAEPRLFTGRDFRPQVRALIL